MSGEITKALADGTAILAVSGGIGTNQGWFDFINANAPALGWMTSVFFGLIAIIFYYLTYRKTSGQEDNTRKIQELSDKINEINERKIND